MPFCDLPERASHFNIWFILNSANPLQSRESQDELTEELGVLDFGKDILE